MGPDSFQEYETPAVVTSQLTPLQALLDLEAVYNVRLRGDVLFSG